jgi:hypothetical protein
VHTHTHICTHTGEGKAFFTGEQTAAINRHIDERFSPGLKAFMHLK